MKYLILIIILLRFCLPCMAADSSSEKEAAIAAIIAGDHRCLAEFIGRVGVDCRDDGPEKKTLLQWAIDKGNANTMRFLLLEGATVSEEHLAALRKAYGNIWLPSLEDFRQFRTWRIAGQYNCVISLNFPCLKIRRDLQVCYDDSVKRVKEIIALSLKCTHLENIDASSLSLHCGPKRLLDDKSLSELKITNGSMIYGYIEKEQ